MKFTRHNSSYQSELDQLFQELKKKDPSLAEQQRKGMALLWNKEPLNLDIQSRDNQSRLKQPAYVYR